MGRLRKVRRYITFIIVGAVLVAAILVVRRYAGTLKQFIAGHPFRGVLLYVLLNIVDALVAPGATLPLIPVAAQVWGRVATAFITTIGWTAGSLIAFLLARHWGYPLVRKLTSLPRLQTIRRYVPKNLFWSVVLARLALPMDVISYVLGLVSDISWARYAAATALGLTPTALLLAYLGKLPHAFEIIAAGVAGVVVVASLIVARRKKRVPL